jgi:agmatine deiminase
MKTRRLPAEWEEQDGVIIPWPHLQTDWAPILEDVEPVFAEIVATISMFERVILLIPVPGCADSQLETAGACMERITQCPVPTDDTWARDFGPITVLEDDNPLLLDFCFNGWGLKFPAGLDNLASQRLSESGVFSRPIETVSLVLEGGSIESDGGGTLLTTSTCLLSPNRNPHLSRKQIEQALSSAFGSSHILWLDNGGLAGDDTDSHIDTLARICPDDTIMYITCNDPQDEHFSPLSAMKAELESFRTRGGEPYRLIPLPFPKPCFDNDKARLPATYANFLVINGAVLVPTYNDASDAAALAAVKEGFPRRSIIGVDSRQIILQHGSLHCLTMQLPKGVLS